MKNEDWKNKKVFITGGTSGLGRALAKEFLVKGARVAILARSKDGLDKVIEENPGIVGIQGDVSKKEEIYPILGQVQSKLGDVNLLFNVASYLGATPLRLLIDTDCEDFEQVLQTNLLGPFRLTKAILPSMIFSGKGQIINISSDAAVNPYPKWGAYGTSKAAIDQMSRIFNEELGEQGIRFLSIDPGDMNTPMHLAAIPTANISELRDPKDSAQNIIRLLECDDYSLVRRSV